MQGNQCIRAATFIGAFIFGMMSTRSRNQVTQYQLNKPQLYIINLMLKSELIKNLEESRETFLDLLDQFPDSLIRTEGVIGNWTIKDILVHLSRREAEIIKLIWQIKINNHPKMVRMDTQTNFQDQNEMWYLESRSRPFERVLEDFHSVRTQIIIRVEDLDNQDLDVMVSGYQSKSMPLYQLIKESTYAHEQEHLQDILAWMKKTTNNKIGGLNEGKKRCESTVGKMIN